MFLLKKRRSAAMIALCLALACAALGTSCAPRAAEPSKAEDEQPIAVDFTWSPDSNCAMCHASEESSMSDASCLASTHEKEGNTCATCHADSDALATTHENATPELAQKKSAAAGPSNASIDETACFSCHGSYEDLAAITAGSAVLTDSDGTVVNPHALPESEDHAATTCASCHAMHDDEPAADSAPAYCASCHHAGVYTCNTCHE